MQRRGREEACVEQVERGLLQRFRVRVQAGEGEQASGYDGYLALAASCVAQVWEHAQVRAVRFYPRCK